MPPSPADTGAILHTEAPFPREPGTLLGQNIKRVVYEKLDLISAYVKKKNGNTEINYHSRNINNIMYGNVASYV